MASFASRKASTKLPRLWPVSWTEHIGAHKHGTAAGLEADPEKGAAMLRITVNRTRKALTFRLEGKLAAPWLRELKECWRSTIVPHRKPIVRVDLSGLTFIDNAGKACLAAMHRQGAELIARDCMTNDVVREIREGCWPTIAGETTG